MDDPDTSKKEILDAVLARDIDRLSTVNILRYDDMPTQLKPFDKHVTAFEVASHHGYTECIRKLLELGIDLFYLNTTYKRALLRASLGSHWECVRLLSRHALFDEKLVNERQGLKEFILATERMDFNHVQDLLQSDFGFKDWIGGVEGSNLMSLLIFYNSPLNVLQLMISCEIKMNGHDRHGFTPLMSAVIAGSVEITSFLLKNGADKNLCDKRDASMNCTDDNLKENFKWDVVDGESKTALMYAVNANKFECLDLLVKSGADINVVDEGGFTALMHAAYVGNSKCAHQILGCGKKTDVNVVDKKKRSALIHAAYSGDVVCVEVFLRAQADQFSKDCCRRTAFTAAVISKNGKCAERLLTPEENVDAEDTKGKTSIMYAAECGSFELLEMLLKTVKSQPPSAGKQKDRIAAHMKAALFSAVKTGAYSCVDLLIQLKCSVNCVDLDEETPLMHACRSGSMECFNLLIKHGADRKAVSKTKKNTMIMYAVYGDVKCFEFLLEKKAKVNVQNSEGETALMMACAAGREDCCDLLLKSGAKLDTVNRIKQTALMYAAKKGKVACFKLLLDAGADVNKADTYDHTVVFYSFSSQQCCSALLANKGTKFLGDKMHSTSFFHSDVKSVPIEIVVALMTNRNMHWHHLCQEPVPVFFSAILSGLSPSALATMFEGRVYSLARTFFGGDSRVVRYLLANLYFTLEDYKIITSDPDFKRSLKERGDYDMVSIFDQISSQPCSLQTLSFLSVSTCISSSSSDLTRAALVDSLSVPDNLRDRLKFRGPLSKLCPQDWASIGSLPDSVQMQNLLCLTQPVWPYPEHLFPCGRKMCTCFGQGLAFQMVKK